MKIDIDIYGKDIKNRDTVLAIGFFDGVHIGHKKIFSETNKQKKLIQNTLSVALTFNQHPLCLVSPHKAPAMINTLSQKIENILKTGIDSVAVVHFTEELANLTPDDFIKLLIKDKLSGKSITVGANFRFGKARLGDTNFLLENQERYDYVMNEVPSILINGGPVSSTRIRAAVMETRMEDARKFLGNYFSLRGIVGRGYQIGTELGYPTANLITAKEQLIPGNGVYVVASYIDDKLYFGGCNVGVRPTFGINDISIETHFVYWTGDLYGKELEYQFIGKIRDEMQFSSTEKLIKRLDQDMATVKEYSDEPNLLFYNKD